jgi:hypothetical protein
MIAINKPEDGKCGYIGFYNGKQIEIYADTKYAAQELALSHFKPPKSKKYNVFVELAEINCQPVVHTPH